ncbi:PREDICTED: craniofacial development protein 2-like [Nicotiana attenuata]|uniref:craniofacial development protein 2-like n=1 Tax=Nicotiana attenuata TaxID=49451 RepID=UPI00090536FE|nr:PREDICTED: craniofacial development protein 2-like [Nicotiana attenuata]
MDYWMDLIHAVWRWSGGARAQALEQQIYAGFRSIGSIPSRKFQGHVLGESGCGEGVGQGSGGGTGPKWGKGNKIAYRLRIGSWNIGTLSGKFLELAKILQKRRVNIACVQETRWVGSKARDADGYKLWFSGVVKGKNGVGILVDRELRESVVEVRRVNDRLIAIKVVVGGSTLNVISAYAPQTGLDEEVKRCFWEALDEVVRGIPPTEKLFIGGDFNDHIGSSADGYSEVHGGFGFGDRNRSGTSCWISLELLSW